MLIWCVVKVLLYSQFIGLAFCDLRLKENVQDANVTLLRDAIDRIQLREYDFKYEQLFNPIFGKRQLGVLAQDVGEVFPRGIGVVPKRAVGHPDDEEPTILEDVYVLNSEALFMANIGATQELSRIIDDLVRILDKTSKDASTAKAASQQLTSLAEKQHELEKLARRANDRSEDALKVEQTVSSLEKDTERRNKEQVEILAKLERIDQTVRDEMKEQSSLHREIAQDATKMDLTLESLKEKVKELKEFHNNEKIQNKDLHSNHAESYSKLSTKLDQTCSDLEDHAKLVKDAHSDVKEHKTQITELSSHIDKVKQGQIDHSELLNRARRELGDEMSTLSKSFQSDTAELKKKFSSELERLDKEVANIKENLEKLSLAIDKQAGQELVERRKALEAEARLEEAKIELEKTRAEEQRKTAQVLADIEADRQARQDNATLDRLQKEESIRAQRELDSIKAKEEADRRHATLLAGQELELERAKAKKELELAQSKAEIAKETAIAQAREETFRERENSDVRKDHTITMIKTVASEVYASIEMVMNSPVQVLSVIGGFVLLALGIYTSRELTLFWRKYMEVNLGQPSLVRETSRGGITLTSTIYNTIVRVRVCAYRLYISKYGSEDLKQNVEKEIELERSRKDCFGKYLSDVVLPEQQIAQLGRIARAARSAHENNAPLRHVLFYGPPGVGKTLVARHLAQWCDLDYAIMSGADVAPLKERAVTEIHSLFKWANTSRRGVLLFIDEADAFLATRDRGSISESLRNALTALLFHTGSQNCKVMLVLATNRPEDIDRAVIDRIDESVQFKLPGEDERKVLVQQYYRLSVESTYHDVIPSSMLRDTALRMEGFSGREIAKFMSTVQAHVYGSRSNVLDKDLYKQVMEHTLKEHEKMNILQN